MVGPAGLEPATKRLSSWSKLIGAREVQEKEDGESTYYEPEDPEPVQNSKLAFHTPGHEQADNYQNKGQPKCEIYWMDIV